MILDAYQPRTGDDYDRWSPLVTAARRPRLTVGFGVIERSNGCVRSLQPSMRGGVRPMGQQRAVIACRPAPSVSVSRLSGSGACFVIVAEWGSCGLGGGMFWALRRGAVC